jgi:hypothetical protein
MTSTRYQLSLKTDSDQTTRIIIKAADTALGKKWSRLMDRAIGKPLTHTDRIYGLNDKWSIEGGFEQLREWHDTFELYDHTLINYDFDFDGLDYTDKEAMQDFLNKLHETFVEIMDIRRPGIDQGAVAKQLHPQWVIDMSQDFNILIHRIEGMIRGTNRQIVVSWEKKEREQLFRNEMQQFVNIIEPGSVVFKYLGTGKKLYEAYKDNDVDSIANGHVVPQFDVAADFIIKFNGGGTTEDDVAFTEWLEDQGIDPWNTHCRNIWGVVGHIEGDPNLVAEYVHGVAEIVSVTKL